MYKRVQQAASNYFKSQGKKQVPANLAAASGFNENALREAYAQTVKNKDAEISRQMKSHIKDSMRISVKELGQIHYQNGYLTEANQQWMKSNDMSVEDDDIL